MRYRLRTLLILLAGCHYGATIIQPDESTLSAITETQVRLNMYLVANNSLPPDLASLPERNGYANQTTDGWGRALIYSLKADGTISLTSLGRDGAPGGTGDDADIVRQFRIRSDDGTTEITEIHEKSEGKN